MESKPYSISIVYTHLENLKKLTKKQKEKEGVRSE